MDAVATAVDDADPDECWCCGSPQPRDDMLKLGAHPEVTICLPCAHYLHKRAVGLRDDDRTGVTPTVRDALRWCRRGIVEHGWHRRPVIGRPLRWIGRYLP